MSTYNKQKKKLWGFFKIYYKNKVKKIEIIKYKIFNNTYWDFGKINVPMNK